MSRVVKREENGGNLGEMLKTYYELKEQEKYIKSQLSKLNTSIKEVVGTQPSVSDGGYVAKISIRTKEIQDEDLMVAIAKENKYNFVIKTKEVLDTEKFIDAVYDEKIDLSLFAPAISTKETVALTVVEEK